MVLKSFRETVYKYFWHLTNSKPLLMPIKHFFKELLQIGNEPMQETTTIEIKEYYDNQGFDLSR